MKPNNLWLERQSLSEGTSWFLYRLAGAHSPLLLSGPDFCLFLGWFFFVCLFSIYESRAHLNFPPHGISSLDSERVLCWFINTSPCYEESPNKYDGFCIRFHERIPQTVFQQIPEPQFVSLRSRFVRNILERRSILCIWGSLNIYLFGCDGPLLPRAGSFLGVRGLSSTA